MDPSAVERRFSRRTQWPLDVARWAAVAMAVATLMLGALSALAMGMMEEPRQVVLLRSGRIIEGQVLREPDRWAVRLGSGSYIRLELDQVDLVADDLAGLRSAMQARVAPGQLSERVKIARFCIQQGMYDEAEEEIAWLRDDGLDPTTIERLSAHLEVSRRPSRHVTTETERSNPVAPSMTETSLNESPSSEEAPIDSELLTVFVQRIQPPLLVGCAAAKCHGPQGTNAFRLQRMELGAPPTRRMSLANYRELYRLANEGVSQGTITDWALRAHGGRKDPVWRADDSKVTELQAWIEWVRKSASQSDVAAAGEANANGVQPASFQQGNSPAADSAADPYDPQLYHAYIRKRQPRPPVTPDSESPDSAAPLEPAGNLGVAPLQTMPPTETAPPVLLPPRDR